MSAKRAKKSNIQLGFLIDQTFLPIRHLSPEAKFLRVLHYNILNGFNLSDLPIQAFFEFLKQDRIDILMLNEYRSSPALNNALEDLGYIHSAVNIHHDSLNRAATFSQVAINELVALPEAFRVVWVVINGINFIIYHASPSGVQAVKAEVQSILTLLQGIDRVVICGDFNSLSRHDLETLEYMRLAGTPAVERYSENMALSFAAIEMFQREGFIDNRAPEPQHTVPTTIYREHEHGATLRLDYILSRNVTITDAMILRDAPFDWLSDHFPISFTIQE